MASSPAPHTPSSPAAEVDADAELLFQRLCQDLRDLTREQLQQAGGGRQINPHALVNESCRRLRTQPASAQTERRHYLAHAGRAMRRVVVDLLRSERTAGADTSDPLTLDSQLGERLPSPCGEAEILRVHEALDDLQRLDARMARVVELRFFGGLTEAEVAGVLAVNERTVRRDWQQARRFLADRWAA